MESQFIGCVCSALFLLLYYSYVECLTLKQSSASEAFLAEPRVYDPREKRYITNTKKENGEHASQLQITLDVKGQPLILDLFLNRDLISKGFFEKYQENGNDIIFNPTKEEVDHCHYSGKVRDKPSSFVALSTCDGLSGIIYDGNEMHYVEKNTSIAKSPLEIPHFIYKNSDFAEGNTVYGNEGKPSNEYMKVYTRNKRSSVNEKKVYRPYNANNDSRYVELILVVDNSAFMYLGQNKEKAVLYCKNLANLVNALYSSLNIFVALTGVVIWSEKDEISISENADELLSSFLSYRKTKLNPEHTNDNAQLISKHVFEGGVINKALKGPICTHEFSGGVNIISSSMIGFTALTVAHSLGHNFGMEHDTKDCICPDDRCIMSSSVSSVLQTLPTHWSSCSVESLKQAFSHGMDYCLKNRPESLYDGPVCGNGFVEAGEECDCGLPDYCSNNCCNAHTCTLHTNATCATGQCCDLDTCKPKKAGMLCRAIDDECDLPEFCTGLSEYCPSDVYKMDTTKCGDGETFCYQGTCKSRTDQCKLLWGPTGRVSDDVCYNLNMKGYRFGNCGFNKFNESYSKCEPQDVQCGLLPCTHLNERLEFGLESVAILSHSFVQSKGRIIPCRTVHVDLGTQQADPGLTPDGAKCGESKMCVDQKCVTIEYIRRQMPSCPKNCTGNGWCNNKGHCHCKKGFAPPLCEDSGSGGSEDSGPIVDSNEYEEVTEGLIDTLSEDISLDTTTSSINVVTVIL